MKPFLLILATALAAAPASPPRELRFAIAGDLKTFDPLQVSDIQSQTVAYLTSGVLVRVNRVTDRVEPELAESWQISDAGRLITFQLRPGLKFSDGTPLTAADVAHALDRALDPKAGSAIADVVRADGADPVFTVTSPLKISVRYKTVKAALDRVFDSVPIVPAGAAKLPASSGPFFVSGYQPGEYVLLSRNPNYWKHDPSGRPLPYLDSIRIAIQQNRDIELSRFLRGDLQLIDSLTPENFARISKEKPGAARNLGASLDSEFLWFNQSPAKSLPEWKRKWFTSAAFRHAVSDAVHRDDIVRIVYRGYAHPAAGPVSAANRFWFNAGLKPLATDPNAALKLLASDGFALRDGVLRDRDGHPVEFSLITNAGNPLRAKIGALIQNDLHAIGIAVNFVPLEMGSLLERISKSLDYEAVLLGFQNVGTDPGDEMNVWLSSGPQHPWSPREKTPATPWEARIDELERRQSSDASRDGRKKAIDELQRIVAAEEPVIYLVNPDYLCAIAPSLKGARPGPLPPQVLWNVEWLRLD